MVKVFHKITKKRGLTEAHPIRGSLDVSPDSVADPKVMEALSTRWKASNLPNKLWKKWPMQPGQCQGPNQLPMEFGD
jgi:hypothetical protein